MQNLQFAFSEVFDDDATQREVYNIVARPVVTRCQSSASADVLYAISPPFVPGSAIDGYNATLFAYGQTGSGKVPA